MRGSIDDIIALPEVSAKIADLLEDPAYEFHREEVLPLMRRKSAAPHPPRTDLSPLPLRDLKRSKTPLELGSCGDNAAIDFLEAEEPILEVCADLQLSPEEEEKEDKARQHTWKRPGANPALHLDLNFSDDELNVGEEEKVPAPPSLPNKERNQIY